MNSFQPKNDQLGLVGLEKLKNGQKESLKETYFGRELIKVAIGNKIEPTCDA